MPNYSEVAASMTEFGCECTVTVEGETRTFFGKGRNKKSAKTLAAEGALAFIETNKPHLLEEPPLPVSCKWLCIYFCDDRVFNFAGNG